mmetsp:Transcript_8234/g.16224  ORF Transcript_8234/g.16224 Transcript_8234/m.16224 type:complete len:439 (+) Transcript_8234:6021-7337(+)|eukprot:CAMPEP_0204910054 /NCGR_PEP_ID=MMETSP1397-20131031/8649_1 /ASSEMBLY_ACC=CAM_ASM_000891 /TAXON_ID=49980 /ORGANISM="Climacostomum Climacostomum virens, Strain Stock W-24" /LENGTH=438 /DNA_ID=CAMNT_0052080069 /DNA_START=10 /DNA_END=1326 /DNA_ORIENTATION=+
MRIGIPLFSGLIAALLCITVQQAHAAVPESLTFEERKSFFKRFHPNFINCTLHYIDDVRGFGFIATEDILFNSPILASPGSSAISSFETHPFSKYFGESQILNMLSRLLYERLVSRNFNDVKNKYVHALPHDHNYALAWDDRIKEIGLASHFQHTDFPSLNTAYKQHKHRFLQIVEESPAVYQLCPMCANGESFDWAYFIVLSRCFEIMKNDWLRLQGYPVNPSNSEQGLALFPVFDLVNHRPREIGRDFSEYQLMQIQTGQPSGLVMYAERDFKKGQEVTMSYSNYANKILMYNYGFVVERNSAQVLQFMLNTEQPCPGESTEPGKCTFVLDMIAPNEDLLEVVAKDFEKDHPEYILSAEQRGVVAALKYRRTFREVLNNLSESLRLMRRLQKTELTKEERLSIEFIISDLVTYYEHAKLSDRQCLKSLVAALDLAN